MLYLLYIYKTTLLNIEVQPQPNLYFEPVVKGLLSNTIQALLKHHHG